MGFMETTIYLYRFLDWCKGISTGTPSNWWVKPWFPAKIFPLINPLSSTYPIYTLWQTYKKLLNMAIEIVSFPINNGDFP